MSVRPTQTKSGYPRRSRQPYPLTEGTGAGGPAAAAGPDEAVPDAGPVEPTAGATPPGPGGRLDRRAKRAIRQSRRTLALACVLLVAVCLVLTILIVNMARNRPAGLSPVPSPLVAVGPPTRPFVVPTHQTRDAPASEGGTR